MAGRTTARPFTGRQQRLVFFLGLLFAGIAAVVVFAIASGLGGGDGSGSGAAANRAVVVAGQDIPANTLVTPQMLEVKYLPADEVNPESFSALGQVGDRVATQDVAAGDHIVPALNVSSSAGERVSFVVQPGYRAISVEVREVVTAGGNVQPGDHVDIVGIFEVADVEAANHLLKILGSPHQVTAPPRPAEPAFSTTQEGEEEEETNQETLVLTVTLLQDVKLLAIAQSLTETTAGGDAADDAEDAEPNPAAATATLELTPQQAQEITTSDEYAILRMDARALGDDEVVDVVPTLLRIEKS